MPRGRKRCRLNRATARFSAFSPARRRPIAYWAGKQQQNAWQGQVGNVHGNDSNARNGMVPSRLAASIAAQNSAYSCSEMRARNHFKAGYLRSGAFLPSPYEIGMRWMLGRFWYGGFGNDSPSFSQLCSKQHGAHSRLRTGTARRRNGAPSSGLSPVVNCRTGDGGRGISKIFHTHESEDPFWFDVRRMRAPSRWVLS